MRILHVLHSLDQGYGGPLRAVLDLSARSQALGVRSEVLGFGPLRVPDNPLSAALIHSLPVGFPRHYCYSPGLRAWLRARLPGYDGVILHGAWLYPNWAASLECRALGRPYAYFPHGMLDRWCVFGQGWAKAAKKLAYWAWRERKVAKGARCAFFTTRREMVLTQQVFPMGKCAIMVPCGVDRISTQPVTAPAQERLAQPEDRKIALFLGRIHPKKNVEFLLRAWSEANLSSEWCLIVAGPAEPHYLSGLERLAARLRLRAQVHFVGPVSGADKSYLLQRSQWFLLPSQQENFGIAVLEAISNGCPAAVSDQVYISDYLHSRSEVLPLELDAWTTFLRDRMPNEEWRRELIALDQEHVVPRFRFEVVASAWTATLKEVFGAGDGSGLS